MSSGISTLAVVAIVVAALRLGQDVLMPLAVAVLVSFLLAPLVSRIERLVSYRALAVLAVVLLVSALLAGLGYVVGGQVTTLAAELPKYRSNLIAKSRLLGDALGEVGEAAEDLEKLERDLTQDATAGAGERPAPQVEVVPSRPGLVATLRQLVAPVLGPAGNIALVVVFAVFMLLQREDLRDRLIRLSGGRNLSLTTQAMDDAGTRVSRYLLTTLMLNAVHGTVIGLGLFWIGLPAPLLWGLLSMLFRFIPYVGPWMAAALPIALSLAVFEDWTSTLLTIGLFAGTELASNNLLEPWLYGHRTGLSPFGVIVSAAFWAWLWGGIGLLLAIPLTVCLVVFGRYAPRFGFLNVLLADTPALSPEVRLYQRLLAGDADEASALFEETVEASSLLESLDALALPALALIARERGRDAIDAGQEARMRECLAEIVEEARSDAEPSTPPGDRGASLTIVCIPASDANDELAAHWLAEQLGERGMRGIATASLGLVSESVERTVREGADAVVISAVSPGGSGSVRYLWKRLFARSPELEILIGLWADPAGVERARARGMPGNIRWVGTLAEALEEISRSTQRLQLRRAGGEARAATG